jgi:hypothetical protein
MINICQSTMSDEQRTWSSDASRWARQEVNAFDTRQRYVMFDILNPKSLDLAAEVPSISDHVLRCLGLDQV